MVMLQDFQKDNMKKTEDNDKWVLLFKCLGASGQITRYNNRVSISFEAIIMILVASISAGIIISNLVY